MEPRVILIGAGVSAALLGVAFYAKANAATPAENVDVDMGQPPVYFMPAGNANSGDYSSNAGGNQAVLPNGTGIGGTGLSMFPYMSADVNAESAIPVNPIFSDPVMASQAIAESQIQAGLIDSLAQYGAAMLSNVINQFAANDVNPSKFTGSFDVVGGKTTFSYDSFIPTPTAYVAPPPPPKKVYTSADVAIPAGSQYWTTGHTSDALWEEILGRKNAEHAAVYGIGLNRPWSSDSGIQGVYNSIVSEYTTRKLATLNA